MPGNKLRRNKLIWTWSSTRKFSQGIFLIAFLGVFLGLPSARLASGFNNFFYRLDPMSIAVSSLAGRHLPAGAALAFVTIVLTIVAGRSWCGWICPLGTLLDIFPLSKKWNSPQESWRGIKNYVLLAVLGSALAGSLTLMIFDPLALLTRSLTNFLWPLCDRLITAIEIVLFPLPGISRFVEMFDNWIRPAILPISPPGSRFVWMYGTVFLGIFFVNLWAPRFWCRYLCPLGAMLGWISRIAILQRRVTQDCKGCALCDRSCPTGTINPEKGYASDPAECTMCMDCLDACPRRSIQFISPLTHPAGQPYDPIRRKVLSFFGLGFIGGLLAVYARPNYVTTERKNHNPYYLQPPGARERASFLSKCIRCGACLRSCPTGALQSALNEAGIEGVWSPIVVPRLGYCDYSCNACGQVCPVEAIPNLSLDIKRLQIIGEAVIDRDRCIVWGQSGDCIICQEMCPIPKKAIWLETAIVKDRLGNSRTLLRPHVDLDLCIGCGICEYRCPVSGRAAIRVNI